MKSDASSSLNTRVTTLENNISEKELAYEETVYNIQTTKASKDTTRVDIPINYQSIYSIMFEEYMFIDIVFSGYCELEQYSSSYNNPAAFIGYHSTTSSTDYKIFTFSNQYESYHRRMINSKILNSSDSFDRRYLYNLSSEIYLRFYEDSISIDSYDIKIFFKQCDINSYIREFNVKIYGINIL